MQKEIKDMEKKRNEMRKKLFEAQDEVEDRKENLIECMEAQLKQNANLEILFTIRWINNLKKTHPGTHSVEA